SASAVHLTSRVSMTPSKVVLVGVVAVIAIVVGAAVDYTHAKSEHDAAVRRVASEYEESAKATLAARGDKIRSECGELPGAGEPLTPTQASCAQSALASLPSPSKPDSAQAGAAA